MKWRWMLLVFVFGLLLIQGISMAQQGNDFSDYERIWPHTDFSQHGVWANEIFYGGPPPDGIPPYYPLDYRYPENSPVRPGQAPLFTVEYTDISTTDAYLPDEQAVIVGKAMRLTMYTLLPEGRWKWFSIIIVPRKALLII
ncbi:MAG: hypothetical protein HC842_09890 [Cytophagales bacterium]|nr:hypothetical protein [Cytophagales bacterium]